MSQQNYLNMDRSTPSFSQDNSFASDIDNYLDLNNENSLFTSPSVTRSSFSSTSATSSNQSTPSMRQTNTVSPEFSGPSHPYDLHSQTIPISSGDMGFGDSMFTNDLPLMQLDGDSSSMPAFFFPEPPVVSSSDMVQAISPHMTTVDEVHVPKPEPQPQRKMYYSGIHQEMYQQKMLQQQQKDTASIRNPKDEQINQVLNSMKASYNAHNGNKNSNDMLPHIAKLKKEEDEMDEDERLLASEEGKKLSSKERRQLRNKVSARAFRSRRKEYISQLEAEVSKKNNEAAALQQENERLKSENQRLEELSKMLLRSSAFSSFLEEMTNNGVDTSAIQQQQQQQQQPKQQMSAAPEPKFNPARDRNPNTTSADEWPLAYSWNPAPQVFTVDIPELPELPDLDGKALLDDDYTICDGFSPRIRNEKGDIDYSRIQEEEEEDDYQPPENLMDVLEEPEKKQNLDDLFPGVGVNQLLERLDKIAGGEAKPEDFFDVPKIEEPEQIEQSQETTDLPPTLCASNKILQEAEGVYRRIGLTVQ